MDNQQAKSFFNIGWMIAMIEADGWLILNKRMIRGKNPNYKPVIGMTNTNIKLVEQMAEIYESWDVGYWRADRKSKNIKWKDQYTIQVSGFKRCKKLLDVILLYMNGKKKQAELISEYIKYRMKVYEKHGVHAHCGKWEENMYQCLKQLNKKGKSFNDYTPG